jgi:DNA polymerase-4
MSAKIIFCMDMDQFFVAVELVHHPHLRGKPVIVGGEPGGRGIVATSSYEARRYGIRAGMSAMEAHRLCPHAIFVHPNIDKYVNVAEKIFRLLWEFTERVEPVSVDEAFLDVTDLVRTPDEVKSLAMRIKHRIREVEGLTATIGAGANRLVAKIASGMNKPDGFTYLPPEHVAEIFHDLPVGDLHGIGRATTEALGRLGIRTAGQLAAFPIDMLRRVFGKWGDDLQKIALGQGDDAVLTPNERPDEKSMGHEHTFEQDLTEPALLLGRVHLLCERVARRLREAKMAGRVVTLKLRFHGFETRFHGRKLKDYLQHETEIFSIARTLFHECFDRRPVRLVGVSVSDLMPDLHLRQLDFFSPHTRLAILSQACDEVKDRFGEEAIGYASGVFFSARSSPSYGIRPRRTKCYRPFHGI